MPSKTVIKAVKNIGHGQIFDENFLMTLATVGAFALMDFDEGGARFCDRSILANPGFPYRAVFGIFRP